MSLLAGFHVMTYCRVALGASARVGCSNLNDRVAHETLISIETLKSTSVGLLPVSRAYGEVIERVDLEHFNVWLFDRCRSSD